MLAAFLTALFFALSSVFASKTTRLVGFFAANFARLWLSAVLLAGWAFSFGEGLRGAGFLLFLVSGVVGFGFGDLAFFAALPLIGSRLSALMVQCLAAPFAALMEWLWLGTKLDNLELLCGGTILAGVALAIAPSRKESGTFGAVVSPQHSRGLFYGLLASIGQAGGAVLSRKAYALARYSRDHIDGGTAAFQRIVGGLIVITLAYPVVRSLAARQTTETRPNWRAAWPWIVANCLAGATLGVSCYQWALATTPSAVVLPIVALTPLVVVPFAYFMEGERPTPRSLAGALLAVSAAATLARLR